MGYDRNKWIYINDDAKQIRYVLGTKGKRTLICFGINPSTAKPDNLDNTLKSVERLSLYNGYDSWIMLNVYPQRSTDPDGIHNVIDKKIHNKNLHYIKQILSGDIRDIWIAWGTIIERRAFLYNCLFDIYSMLKKYNCRYYSIGKISKQGHPHHPLYLRSDLSKEKFDIDLYISKIF